MVDLGGAHMLMAERCARSISTDVPEEKGVAKDCARSGRTAVVRFRCRTGEAEVAFVREVNPDSGDDLPVGIVSAFFRAPTADE
jgi:hypothetical protein